ncbi:MAG: hypothetical protein ACOC0O_03330 [Spirochaetota bacterium]
MGARCPTGKRIRDEIRAKVSTVVAILIRLMIHPMMLNVGFASLLPDVPLVAGRTAG